MQHDHSHDSFSLPLTILWLTAVIAPVPVAAQQANQETDILKNVRQVTSGFVKAGEGYFSPDGTTIIYQAITEDYPFYQIYVQSLDGGAPRRVSTGRGRTTCSYFHPSGDRILFSSSHLDPNLEATERAERERLAEEKRTGRRRRYQWDFDPHMDIFEATPDGRILRRLTSARGYDAEGAYSPDGNRIAFCSDRDGDPDIYLMRSDGSDLRQLTNEPGYDGGPFISPDGNWIVYRTDRKRREYLQIHVMRIDGSDDQALTDNEGVNWGPYWHPTRPYLIWSAADHSDPTVRPNYDLWLMQYEIRDGRFSPGRTSRITTHPAADVLPVFSPDGRKLMWTSTRTADHSSQLHLADFHFGGE